jgi:hypothetical protein
MDVRIICVKYFSVGLSRFAPIWRGETIDGYTPNWTKIDEALNPGSDHPPDL